MPLDWSARPRIRPSPCLRRASADGARPAREVLNTDASAPPTLRAFVLRAWSLALQKQTAGLQDLLSQVASTRLKPDSRTPRGLCARSPRESESALVRFPCDCERKTTHPFFRESDVAMHQTRRGISQPRARTAPGGARRGKLNARRTEELAVAVALDSLHLCDADVDVEEAASGRETCELGVLPTTERLAPGRAGTCRVSQRKTSNARDVVPSVAQAVKDVGAERRLDRHLRAVQRVSAGARASWRSAPTRSSSTTRYAETRASEDTRSDSHTRARAGGAPSGAQPRSRGRGPSRG